MMENFQRKKCPLSLKNAPIIDYKNVNLLKNTYPITEKLCLQKLPLCHLINRENSLERLKS